MDIGIFIPRRGLAPGALLHMIPHGILSAIPEYFFKKKRMRLPFLADLYKPCKVLQVQKLRFRREADAGGGNGPGIGAAAPGQGKARFLRCGGWE